MARSIKPPVTQQDKSNNEPTAAEHALEAILAHRVHEAETGKVVTRSVKSIFEQARAEKANSKKHSCPPL